ncbi:conserved protein of unknown function [Magnetospirillum sp. XM-1]|uniref:DUF7483 domain-containing protein n=1 Tax=Magnetospirillum sp. XM-1 TaxID=1663591 RepID=UPI00073DC9D0|nr:hypothetical protein [Magnetospirillum sp. XM-1]CUW38796.1 conserved protein of unknown function [Magnetospirillum sp. XM-1]
MFLMGSQGPTGYSITNSARFNGTSDYLSKTLTTSATTSGSVWVKRSKLGATSPIFDNKVYFTSGDALYAFGLTSTALYRDPSAWYHIFWNGTGVYVNGTLVTGTGTYTAASVTNPRLGFDGTNYFSGYMSDFAFWNGSSASLQGGAADANGVWAAKRPSAGYSFLAFGSSGALGTDTSGNGNNWTVSGSPVQTVDTPTNNYATYNAVYPGVSGLTNGNMTCTGTARATFDAIRQNSYWEVTASTTGVTSGTVNDAGTASTVSVPNGSTYGFRITTAGVLDYTTNGSSWTNIATVSGQAYPYSTGGTTTVNFGATTLVNSVPATYAKPCTANLPAVSIKKPSDHFNVVLAAGASIKSSSEALYTYFFEWIKDRANSNNHQLIDTVRGASAVLQSNSTGAETTYSAPSGSSVGWVWNAGSAASSNTAGSVASQVSVNAAAGFSVVTWTHTTSGNYTVGHGLGATPKLIIEKGRNAVLGWGVYHPALTAGNRLILNSTSAQVAGYWNGAPTSTTIPYLTTMASNGDTMVAYCFAEIPGYSKFGSYVGNGSTDGPFVYCGFRPRWIMVRGATASGAGSWRIYDTSRDTYNVEANPLYAESSVAEKANDASGFNLIDVTANGFKIRSSASGSETNASGATYIFAAFAEYPFGGSNVAPSPAR